MILQGLRHQSGRSLFTLSTAKKVTTCRFIHFAPRGKCVSVRASVTHDLYKRTNFLAAISVRHNSTTVQTEALSSLPNPTTGETKVLSSLSGTTPVQTEALPSLPDIPVPVPDVAQTLIQYHANGDPTFSSIGLGGYGPVGLLQYLIEALHVHANLSWSGSIIAVSVILKLALLQFYIKGQRLQVKSHNHGPAMEEMRRKMMEEQASGNIMEASLIMAEHRRYIAKHGLSPLKAMGNSVLQGGVSICTFFALRGILSSDLDSLRFGGYWWFADLTIPDPLYLLPIGAVASIAILTETMMTSNVFQAGMMKYIMRGIPIVTLPIMIQFGSGLQLFWISTNVITVLQILITKHPYVQKLLKIPEKLELQSNQLNLSENLKKWKETSELRKGSKGHKYQDHLLLAARQPYVKTFKYNPKAPANDKQKLKMK